MVFIEFTLKDKGGKRYFVGGTVSDVLEDTGDGSMFGSEKFVSWNEVTEDVVRRSVLSKKYPDALDVGMNAVKETGLKSFFVG
jgi:tRNA nucleotidyltransferase/poly(A) polymerase